MALYAAVGGWLAGIWYAARWDLSPLLLLAGALAALVAIVIGRAHPALLGAGVAALALLLGAARMDRAAAGDLSLVASGGAELRGVLVEQRSRGTYLVRVEAPARGTVLLRTRPGGKLRPGDLLHLRGEPEPAAQLEPYERSLARASGAALVLRDPPLEILATDRLGPVGQPLARLRGGLSILLERHVPEGYAAVAEGLLLGGSLGVDRETRAAFRTAGISHILAASGYNVTLFAGMLLAVLRPLLGARRALPAAFLAIFLYAGLAGFSASVVRAALMGAVGVLGLWLGRPHDSSRALAAAALLMTLWQPHALWDIGAQLSFVATAGLLWVYPLLLRALGGLWGPLAEAAAVAVTAQLATLPLALHYFGGLGPWGIVANIVVAPLVPAAMLLGGLTMLLGWAWYPLGEAVGWLTGRVVGAIVGTAEAVAALPGAQLATNTVGSLPVALYYAALLLAVLLPRWASRAAAPAVGTVEA